MHFNIEMCWDSQMRFYIAYLRESGTCSLSTLHSSDPDQNRTVGNSNRIPVRFVFKLNLKEINRRQ